MEVRINAAAGFEVRLDEIIERLIVDFIMFTLIYIILSQHEVESELAPVLGKVICNDCVRLGRDYLRIDNVLRF